MLEKGHPRPDWVLASSAGTPLDISNLSKAFALILDKAELHRRGLHQPRHTFASLLINAGAPITYVSWQLGHKDSAVTLRVYARWLRDDSRQKGVVLLDETQPSATPRNQRVKRPSAKMLEVIGRKMVSHTGMEPMMQ